MIYIYVCVYKIFYQGNFELIVIIKITKLIPVETTERDGLKIPFHFSFWLYVSSILSFRIVKFLTLGIYYVE